MSALAFGPVRRRAYRGETLTGEAIKTGGGWRFEAAPGQVVVAGRFGSLADLGEAVTLAAREGGPTGAPFESEPWNDVDGNPVAVEPMLAEVPFAAAPEEGL